MCSSSQGCTLIGCLRAKDASAHKNIAGLHSGTPGCRTRSTPGIRAPGPGQNPVEQNADFFLPDPDSGRLRVWADVLHGIDTCFEADAFHPRFGMTAVPLSAATLQVEFGQLSQDVANLTQLPESPSLPFLSLCAHLPFALFRAGYLSHCSLALACLHLGYCKKELLEGGCWAGVASLTSFASFGLDFLF